MFAGKGGVRPYRRRPLKPASHYQFSLREGDSNTHCFRIMSPAQHQYWLSRVG